ncbi:MAG: folate-binding protein [Rubrivivax sp.]
MQPSAPASAPPHGGLLLTDWGVIRASGADARSFLHGQLTQDVLGLQPGQARLAGYCSAKGRLLASFVVWLDTAGDDVMLACSGDLLAPTLKRLSMFVLRSKCRLTAAELAVSGLAGPGLPAAEPWAVRPLGEATTIRLPDARGVARWLLVGGTPNALPSETPALDPELWRWLEVHSAVPRITAATVERFVPQMINLDIVGGVNFQKGCYPGQEVVARSQYRGTLKRRAFLLEGEQPLAAGQELFERADPGQPAGLVVLAAAPSGRRAAALAELKIAAAGGELHAGAPDGPVVRVVDLPYPLPVETA